jgi:hypothetical protein
MPAASNRADFKFQVKLIDQLHTGDFVDLDYALITVALRSIPQWEPAINGTNLDGHVVVLGLNVFEVRFTRQEMTQFPAGDLDMGITVEVDGATYQLFSGQVPVVDGVVNR